MESVFFEAMTKDRKTSASIAQFLEVDRVINRLMNKVKALPEDSTDAVQMKGLIALLNLLQLHWSLESQQIKDGKVDFLKMKAFLVHAYQCEYVDYFLDIVFMLAERFTSVNFFETAKVLRLLYQERLKSLKQAKTTSNRVTKMNLFLHKSKIKSFALELKNMEELWSVHQKSKIAGKFKYQDADWKMQSILIELEIDEEVHYEVLDHYSVKKHFKNIEKLCKDLVNFNDNFLFLDPANVSFKELKVYQDLVVLKGKLMDATSHEILSLFEENEFLKCTMFMKTIEMMTALETIAKKEENEAVFYL